VGKYRLPREGRIVPIVGDPLKEREGGKRGTLWKISSAFQKENSLAGETRGRKNGGWGYVSEKARARRKRGESSFRKRTAMERRRTPQGGDTSNAEGRLKQRQRHMKEDPSLRRTFFTRSGADDRKEQAATRLQRYYVGESPRVFRGRIGRGGIQGKGAQEGFKILFEEKEGP